MWTVPSANSVSCRVSFPIEPLIAGAPVHGELSGPVLVRSFRTVVSLTTGGPPAPAAWPNTSPTRRAAAAAVNTYLTRIIPSFCGSERMVSHRDQQKPRKSQVDFRLSARTAETRAAPIETCECCGGLVTIDADGSRHYWHTSKCPTAGTIRGAKAQIKAQLEEPEAGNPR